MEGVPVGKGEEPLEVKSTSRDDSSRIRMMEGRKLLEIWCSSCGRSLKMLERILSRNACSGEN